MALDTFPRGGSTTEEPLHPDPADNSSAPQRVVSLTSLPLIDAASASLALRLTCETNLRLHRGTSSGGGRSSAAPVAAVSATTTEDSRTLQPHQNGMQSHQLHSQPHTGPIPPPIRTISEEELSKERREEERTVFHATEIWEPATEIVNATHSKDTESGDSSNQRRGTLRWGPDLESYIDALLSAVVSSGGGSDTSKQSSPMEDETQIVLALTILYLDRSTSFETPLHIDPQTGQPWCPPCPHLVPRTVHRMALTAMAIAAKCVRGESDVSNLLRQAANAMLGEKCAISEKDLEQMENWMLHALGGAAGVHHSHPHHDVSWQVSHDEAGTFLRKWGETFYPTRLKAHDESRRKQLERFWKEQTTAFGTSHGHGNYWPEGRSGGGTYPHSASLQYSSMEQAPESHPELRGHHPQPHYYQPQASENKF
ncbi:hypothetical protein ACHAXT_001557 [Thalassiosira profunda]